MSRKPQITGAELVAETLRALRVQVVFGIVGIPVVEIAEALIACGIRFIAFRNEQSASYAAQAYGYLTGRPGVCLVVGGPGVVHAMAGIVNAQVNCWPLLVIAGYIESYQKERGGFQELDHISFLKPHTKFASQPPTVTHIPFMLEKAYRTAFYGRPGPAFIDLPANFIKASLASSTAILSSTKLSVPDCPKSMASTDMVSRVCALLRSAKSPLVVIGKGCAYARAESHIRRFINEVQLPFLPTPMGKGVMPDSHPFNVASARSTALAGADVVLLLGARLNWMLHFGTKPKWRADVIFVQVDIAAEELGNNANSSQLHLLGDIGLITAQLRDVLSDWKYDSSRSQFIETLRQNAERNVATARRLAASDRIPMSYQRALTEIKEGLIGLDVVYVSEGANTMDIGRSIFDVQEPRRRLDAGTFATMGVGMGYAIAGISAYVVTPLSNVLAQLVYPNHKVVAVVGDSAFGFRYANVTTFVLMTSALWRSKLLFGQPCRY
jgi:2-hydroxyacyl-CoA lyase 1